MKTYSNLTKLILLFTIHLVVFSLIAWLAPMRWETNDDIGMAMIASGAFHGIPDYHLVFINGILGWLFVKLYTWSSILEWYTIFQCVVHIFSATAIVWYILIKDVSKWIKILWCIFFYVFWFNCVVNIQFTTTAGLAAVAGCLILYNAAISFMSKNPSLHTNGLFVVGGGIFSHLLCLGSMLRD